MDERFAGDRTALCKLLAIIGLLGDDEWLHVHWRSGDVNNSFSSLLSIIFDDFHIKRWSDMETGYLGTPPALPRYLSAIADLLDAFDERQRPCERRSDIELLHFAGWEPISEMAKKISAAVRSWRSKNCAYESRSR